MLFQNPQRLREAATDGSVDEALIWAQLRTCYDPEIPVNIVDLGLVYDCGITPLEGAGNRVDIQMTLTAPGCGMGGVLVEDIRQKSPPSQMLARSMWRWFSIRPGATK